MRYRIVQAMGAPALESAVNQAIRDGWRPTGGLVQREGEELVQAMVHDGLPPFGKPRPLPEPMHR